MKLSDRTTRILRNLLKINRSIKIKQGNQLSTLSIQKNVLASTEVEEIFPREFAIYDLDEFLTICSLSEQSTDLEFENESYVTIRGRDSEAKYFFADPSIVVSPPDKLPDLPSVECEFQLSLSDLQRITTALSIYGHLEDVSIVGRKGVVSVDIRDRQNSSSNTFAIQVGETDATFSFNLKGENLYKLDQDRVLDGYTVRVSKSGVSQWVSSDGVTYLIALEPDSTYEGD